MSESANEKASAIESVSVSVDGEETLLTLLLRIASETHSVCFRVKGQAELSPLAGLPLALPAAMRCGGKLTVPCGLDEEQRYRLESLQEALSTWHSDRSPVQIIAPDRKRPETGTNVGAFFSGGLDSFFTLLRHREEIDTLICITGFDVALGDSWRREKTTHQFRAAATHYGKRLIEVTTNYRDFTSQYGHWGTLFHGPALASVALLLSPSFRKLYVPATHSYRPADLFPWGSHPLTDPLWSTSTLQLVHDGALGRVEKARLVASDAFAMANLRSCRLNFTDRLNCGYCAKCLRTVLAFASIDCLERVQSFPKDVPLAHIEDIKLGGANGLSFLKEIAEEFQRTGAHPRLARAVRRAISRSRLGGEAWHAIRRFLRELLALSLHRPALT